MNYTLSDMLSDRILAEHMILTPTLDSSKKIIE